MFAKYAQYYIDRGLCVIPVDFHKKPRTSWKEYETRKPTAEKIREWSRDRGEMNIAAVTGQISNLTCVDCDTANAIARFEAVLPEHFVLPIDDTPKGGRHYFFQHTPGLSTNAGNRPGTDIRAEGGIILLAPSRTEATPDGKCVDGTYTHHNDIDIRDRPPMPEEVRAYLLNGQPETREGRRGGTPPGQPILTQGTRDQDLFHASLHFFKDKLPQDEIERIVVAMGKACDPPFPENEALAKVASAWKYYSENYLEGETFNPETFDPASVLMTGTVMQTLDLHVDWTVDKLIPEQGLTLLYGPGGVGKTWLCLAIAKAVSTGAPFLGLTTKQKPVFYIDRENPWPMLVDRVRKMNIRDVRFWHLSFAVQPPKLDASNWKIYKKLPTGGLVFFDTSRSCHDGDENSSQDVGLVMGRLKELRELGNDIVLLHHTPRASEKSVKGSTAWEDLADQVLAFHRVRRGSLKEIKEEIESGEYDPDALYHLGTGKKTRYMPAKFYLSADFETGEFTLAEDPIAQIINALGQYIEGEGRGKNQTEIYKWAKENIDGCKGKNKVVAALNRGVRDHRWLVRGGRRGAKHYEPAT